jgi:flagellar hook assembly protein FlgD
MTPNGDWNNESTSVRFGLSRRAVIGVRVLNAATSNLVRTLLASAERSQGTRTMSWDGTTAGGAPVPDGRYQIEVAAADGGESATRRANVVVDRTLGGFSAAPSLLGKAGSLQVGYELTRQATVKVEIRLKGKTVRRVFSGVRPTGVHAVSWNGTGAGGKRLADGNYHAVALATTSLGTRVLARPFTMDATAPAIRIFGFRRSSGVARLRLSLGEDAAVRIFFGRNRWNDGGSATRSWRAGPHTFSRRGGWKVFRIVATDEALNRSSRIYRVS